MKVVEVNVLMYKNVLLTDVGTVVVRYSGTGHDDWWSQLWPVRQGGEGGDRAARGDGDEEEMKRVEREDSLEDGTRRPSRLYTCVSSTTTSSTTSPERARIRRPAKYTRLRQSTHIRVV